MDDEPCLPGFFWLISSSFDEMIWGATQLATSMYDILIEALGKVITDDGSIIPFFTS
jgi:hypothetical protein